MAYNIPFPRQAPWFIYGPHLCPDGKWRAGYVNVNGQLALSTEHAFDNEQSATAYWSAFDYGLARANAKE